MAILKPQDEILTEPGSLLSSGGFFEPTIMMGGAGAGYEPYTLHLKDYESHTLYPARL